MPKSRNTGSIGNFNSEPPSFDEREMSDRLEQRLRDAGAIEVDVESRTRGRSERVSVNFESSDIARVISSSGSEYIVNTIENSCTCPDFEHRQRRCRHIEAAAIAREEVAQGTFQGSIGDQQVSPNQVISEVSQNEINSEIENLQSESFDDNFFYSENEEVFREDLQRLTHEAIPYRYENVLNGSNITFGIELEFVDGDSNAIANELYELGICSTRTMERYHSAGTPGKWKLERDGSVTSGNRGGELISPILTDTPETWRQLEVVCEVARRHGARVNYETGGHIHIGADQALDGKRQRWRRFFKIAAGFEEVYHKLSGGEQGRFRGGHYAPSSLAQNRVGITRTLPQDGTLSEYQGIISNISNGKYQSINISPFNSNKRTVEFRAFNGTLTPGIIQANVMYAAGVIHSAEKSRTKQSEGVTFSESSRKRGEIINNYDTNNNRDNSSIMKALDAIFTRKQDKEHVLSVITKNTWDR